MAGYDDYYPYGMQMSGRSLTASEDGRYKFTGKERDASDGLDYFGHRYYDQWRGGWDQVDPWDYKYPSHSPYNYCSLNPIKLIDSTGKGDGPGDQTDLVSSWFSNTYNSEVTTLSNMAYNTAANFVHWGEDVSELGETVGNYTADLGTGATIASLIIPSLQVYTPEAAETTEFGFSLSFYSGLTNTAFLGLDAKFFGGSVEKFETKMQDVLTDKALDLSGQYFINKTMKVQNPVLEKIYENSIMEIKKVLSF